MNLQHLTVITFQGKLTFGYLLSLPMSRSQGLITLPVRFVFENTSWNHPFVWCDAWSIIWRVPVSTDNISNFYVSPYKPVGSKIIARWLCTSIRSAGVDVSYTGHSTRAASTSEAVESGLPIEAVLEAADWSSARTFEKHYHKQTDRAKFAHKVLSAFHR